MHARVCRSVSGIRTQPGPPRSHARSGWPARRSACRCRRGRVAVLGPGRAPPGRSLNRQGPASSGSVALSVSRALPVRQSPRAARRRRPESGVASERRSGRARRVRAAPAPCRCGKIAVSGCAASPHETSTHRAAARAGAMSDGHTSRPHRAPSHRDAHPTPGPYLTW